MDERQTILQLREELHLHNHRYYVLNEPTISDQEFDAKMKELERLEALNPDMYDPNSPTCRVGSDISDGFDQVEHSSPMLSLANTYNADEVAEFYNSVSRLLKGESFDICCELKYDGLSISLIYEHGRFIRAITRGDGVRGDDVTANVRTIRTIPLVIQTKIQPVSKVLPLFSETFYPINTDNTFEIRGEILMPFQSFEKLNALRRDAEQPLFANPRNAASGTLKSQNPAVVASRHLDAYLYNLIMDNPPTDSHYENLLIARKLGFHVGENMVLAKSLDEVMAYISKWQERRKTLPVATDGVVLKVDSLRQQRLLGSTSKSPRWAIAYKYRAERQLTVLQKVTFQVGRTGQITPVANMNTVQLAGTAVKRATLNNEDFILSLGLCYGDSVYVEKGGEIIPKIVGVETSLRKEGAKPIEFIKECPECHSTLVRYPKEAAWYCPNDTECPPQIKGRIEHFISRKAMNVESLGSETINEMFLRGIIHNPADLYDLTERQIDPFGNREKTAKNILLGIEESKKTPFERVLFALGIRFVGEISAKILARHFENIDALMNAKYDDLTEIEGIGSTMATSIINFFGKMENKQMIERLRQKGVKMQIDRTAVDPNLQPIKGLNIVISGIFERHTREEYKDIIERNGGRNTTSISANTSFLLAGKNMGPAKKNKAKSLGIRIINEEEFLNMIHQDDKD